MAKNEISIKIKDEYGTLVNFCKKEKINLNTFKAVLYGREKSSRIMGILDKYGFLSKQENNQNVRCTY